MEFEMKVVRLTKDENGYFLTLETTEGYGQIVVKASYDSVQSIAVGDLFKATKITV